MSEMLIIITIAVFIFLFDFARIRKQNDTLIEQNEKVISLLEEIKNK
ncbi:hypothetical protein K7887_02490 [Sutcliffiella horikoshii]|nr:hypothetical protein [Sutcliffiella horikoshii]UAL49705.1 hypothetical protein K7887_02490 [Sutcliffiella horikoshii]